MVALVKSDGMGSAVEHHLAVTAKAAAEVGLEIKVGIGCDYLTSTDVVFDDLRNYF